MAADRQERRHPMQKQSLFHRYFLSYMIVLILPLLIIVGIVTHIVMTKRS